MSVKVKDFFFFLVLSVIGLNAQKTDSKHLDSITYQELWSIYTGPTNEYIERYAKYHFEKAKKEKDTYQLATSYRMRAFWEEMPVAMKLLDTALYFAKKVPKQQMHIHNNALAEVYYTKGAILLPMIKISQLPKHLLRVGIMQKRVMIRI
ncbi:MAG: hypothetical protein AAGL34_14285 [Bacteroidota bacterium]